MQPLSVSKYKSLVQTGTLWYAVFYLFQIQDYKCCNKIKALVKLSVSFCHIVKCGSQSPGLAECLAQSHTPTHIQKERSLQPCQLMQQQLSLAMPVWHTDTPWSPAHRLRACSSLSLRVPPPTVCLPALPNLAQTSEHANERPRNTGHSFCTIFPFRSQQVCKYLKS